MGTNFNLDELIKQLEQEQQAQQQVQQESEPQAQTQPQQEPQVQPQPEPQVQQQVQPEPDANIDELRRQVEDWINLGKQVFIARYQGNPEVLRVLQYIETKARALLSADIQKGTPKEDFYSYMEQARVEVQKELAETLKSLNNLNIPNYNQQAQPKTQQEPLYTVDDYYNDYKAMLEAITDEHATIRFFDGMKTPEGKIKTYGEGKKKLGERPVLD